MDIKTSHVIRWIKCTNCNNTGNMVTDYIYSDSDRHTLICYRIRCTYCHHSKTKFMVRKLNEEM